MVSGAAQRMARCVYGEGLEFTAAVTMKSNLADYGRLYNWYAVDDARGLCPSGWHVPTDGEYMTLNDWDERIWRRRSGWRGTDQGTQMKSSA